MRVRRRWLALGWKTARLLLRGPDQTPELVSAGYDRIAEGYDAAWTDHMRGLSLAMLNRLAPPAGAACLDLTCGTGFVTAELARRCGRLVLGVDSSGPGFSTVRIAPHLGSLTQASGRVPHPRGFVDVSLKRTGDVLEATIALPAGVTGELVWRGTASPLKPGSQTVPSGR